MLIHTVWLGSYATELDDVGYTQLVNEFGASLKDGATIEVMLVEANTGNAQANPPTYVYRPNPGHSEFSGKTITDVTGLSTSSSGHATTVGRNFFGNTTSVAPGVVTIYAYLTDDWLFSGYLNFNSILQPNVAPGSVMNHSWIGNFASDSHNEVVLGRLDVAIERDGVTTVVGTGNGAGTVLPKLMVQGYNSISVGRSDGSHKYGNTTIAVSNRMKPDMVAPKTTTSSATGFVSGAAALLQDLGETLTSAQATRPEIIKSVLMAGATKEESESGFSWSQSLPAQPLDTVYGAGELNVYNSYLIMGADEQPPFDALVPASVATSGWNYGTVNTGQAQQKYFFEVPVGQVAMDVSIVLTWHRDVAAGALVVNSSLDNLSLSLNEADEFVEGANIATSDSTVDNVEHIYIAGPLSPGQYAILVDGPAGTFDADYGIAWRSTIQYPQTYAQWAAAELNDSNLQASDLLETGDPDKDGYINQLEYALGTKPTLENGTLTTQSLETVGNDQYIALTFTRRKLSTDVLYAVGLSTDLSSWDYTEANIQEVGAVDIDDERETVTFRSTNPITNVAPEFIRLRVSDQ